MIFFISIIFLSSIVNSQVYKTEQAQLLINKYESNYSNNELDKLRAIYKKHIRSADFETGLIERNISYGKHPLQKIDICLLYTSPSPRDMRRSRMPSSA